MMPRKQRNSDDSRLFEIAVCAFCGINEDNELLYGKYIVSNDICVHTNCMFFASGLSQGGKNNNKLCGFLLPDIEAELRRGKKLMCTYCRKRGPTIGCCVVKCKKSFHLPCGLEHNSLHQFFGTFSSYCKDHSPKQKPVEVLKDLFCHICCEEILLEDLNSCLYSPCCKNSWFHRVCLQKYALSAGLYFFKCPLCNNSTEFVKEMKLHGICIPDKDASWELEENAFQDLLQRPECDASVCKCNKGRKYRTVKNSGWTILPCSYCGYHARHKTCENIKLSTTAWICHECKSLEEKISNDKLSTPELVNSSKKSDGKNSDNEANCSTISSVSSSSTFHYLLSPYIFDCTKDKVDDIFQNHFTNQLPLIQMHTNKIIVNDNHIKCELEDISHCNVSDLEQSTNIGSNDFINNSTSKKPEITSQDKQGNHLKDIKNFIYSTSPSKRHSVALKTPVKKVTKKRKVNHVCNDPNHSCIKKYFSQGCGKYGV